MCFNRPADRIYKNYKMRIFHFELLLMVSRQVVVWLPFHVHRTRVMAVDLCANKVPHFFVGPVFWFEFPVVELRWRSCASLTQPQ